MAGQQNAPRQNPAPQQRKQAPAQQPAAQAQPQETVDDLLAQLDDTNDQAEKRRIRAKLRNRGYRLSDNKPEKPAPATTKPARKQAQAPAASGVPTNQAPPARQQRAATAPAQRQNATGARRTTAQQQ